jgi:phospholipid-binding lipoprotein MlaA
MKKDLKRIFLMLTIFAFLIPVEILAQEASDPLEKYNRSMFWVNDKLDTYLINPVSKGYDYITPDVVQKSVSSFFQNIKTPVYLVSDIVQLNVKDFGLHGSRFLLNSTIGIAGLFDISKSFGLEHKNADFGLALGKNGMPSGPYFVIPILGPSTLRDAGGRLIDTFLNPIFYIPQLNLHSETEDALIYGLTVLDAVNARAELGTAPNSAKEASLDYYLFVRSAYLQKRNKEIRGITPKDLDFEEEGQ